MTNLKTVIFQLAYLYIDCTAESSEIYTVFFLGTKLSTTNEEKKIVFWLAGRINSERDPLGLGEIITAFHICEGRHP